jgi:15-cis-phytoene synthase
LLPLEDRRAQKSGLMMAAIYRDLLREIERSNFQVLNQRISLTPLRKLWLAWKVQAFG